MRIYLVALLVLSVSVCNSQVQTLTLNPIKDNTIYKDEAKSFGGGTTFFAGRNGAGKARRALIQFDLLSLPLNVQIDSVKLVVTCDQTNANNKLVSLHRLTTDWGEGTQGSSGGAGGGGAGGVAEVGDATWTDAKHTTQAWNTVGGDFIADTSVSMVLAGTGEYEFKSLRLAQDVQNWATGINDNYGWVVIGQEDAGITAYRFVSKEGLAAKQPELRIYYHIITSIDLELEESSIVFQNPVNDHINIPEGVSLPSVAICSIHGKHIVEYPLVVNSIDVSDLKPGIYQFTYVKNNKRLAQKFIKQ